MMKKNNQDDFLCLDLMPADMEDDCKTAAPAEEGPDLMALYMHDVGSVKLLDAEAERRLGELVCHGTEAEQLAARNALISANLRLVVKIAHDFKGKGLPLPELVAEGNLGLARAAEKFRPDMNAKFSTYASWWIRQAMYSAAAAQAYPFRLPPEKAVQMRKFADMEKVLEEKLGRAPSDDELAAKLKMSTRIVAQLRSLRIRCVNLDAPVGDDTDNTYGDIIPDREAAQPDSACFDRDMSSKLQKHFRKLSQKEQQVLKLCICEQKSFTEASRKLGRSHERIRQIQQDALNKLRRYLVDGRNAA